MDQILGLLGLFLIFLGVRQYALYSTVVSLQQENKHLWSAIYNYGDDESRKNHIREANDLRVQRNL